MTAEIPVPPRTPPVVPVPRAAAAEESPAGAEHRPVMAPRPGQEDRSLLRIGAVAGVLGVVLQVAGAQLHPSHADPNDSAAAFAEYARSDVWEAAHIVQYLGTLLITIALVALARSAARRPGTGGALAVVGGVLAVVVAAVFTVQMAVDGVALKAAVDAWSGAADADKPMAFLMADDVRAVEKGLAGFFQMTNGLTLLTLGLSLLLGRAFPRWLGGTAAVAGIGWLVGGVATAYTGFSAEASSILLGPLVLSIVFLAGACVVMWRRSTSAA